jgi:hypothetical protein
MDSRLHRQTGKRCVRLGNRMHAHVALVFFGRDPIQGLKGRPMMRMRLLGRGDQDVGVKEDSH